MFWKKLVSGRELCGFQKNRYRERRRDTDT